MQLDNSCFGCVREREMERVGVRERERVGGSEGVGGRERSPGINKGVELSILKQ